MREEYNSKGKRTKAIDPVGRETVYVYGTNNVPDADPVTGAGLDLLQVKRKNGSSYELLKSFTYNDKHQRLTETDAAGQTTIFTYLPDGRVETVVTPARNGLQPGEGTPRALTAAERTTTYEYFPLDGTTSAARLKRVTGPTTALGQPVLDYTYDSYSRTRTATDSDSYSMVYDYDALDRVTKVTYPDGTFEEVGYNRLDMERRRDRLGRWTHFFHDALRHAVAERDPLGRTTTYEWCGCGSLDKVVDAKGNATRWERDLQGRITKEQRANGGEWLYAYENTTSRVKQATDPKQQTKNYTYYGDDSLQQISYANAAVATPSVTYTYDPAYHRLASRQDGTGTSVYAYHPIQTPPALGAGKLASLDGPLNDDTTTFTYDELGGVAMQKVNGVILSAPMADALGRIARYESSLGTFNYGYVGTTNRLETVSYPNGQSVSLDYFDNVGDRRLEEIHNKLPGGATLSRFTYGYDAAGRIRTWGQQIDSGPVNTFELGYDGADQLTQATLKSPSTILKSYSYAYDSASNRTAEGIDSSVTAASFDNVNRRLSQQAGGPLGFAGTVSEPASVTIGSSPAQVGADNKFTGGATVASGENTVTIMATDPSGNMRTNTYQVTVSASSASFTFDANGNLTGDGSRTYEWDGADRLVAISQGARRSEFTYDGEGKRVRILEKDGAVVLGDQRYVWCHTLLCEERDSSGTAVTKRFFGLGVEEGANKYFYTLDHLTSVREMTDSTAALRARYEYDPYGRVTKVIGDKDAFFTFAGHQRHSPSGLILAPYRAYDTTLGQWVSEDPLGYVDGLNLYAYVLADPIGNKDALGLQSGGTGGSTYPEPPQPPMPPPTVPDPKPPIPPRQPPTTTQPPTTPTTPTIIWVTRTITILTAIYVACTTEWVPDVYTDVEAYEASKGRNCNCTCLGRVHPDWNPTDRKHGDRYVGPQPHRAECKAECELRGFDNFECK